MTKANLSAIFLIAACAISTGAWGQKVYRCGSSYSQIPCNGAVTVETQDARSKTQKIQSDQATVRDLATANSMEKDRKQEEAKTIAQSNAALKAGQAPESKAKPKAKSKTMAKAQPQAKDDPSADKPGASKKKASKKDAPEFFTAQGEAPKKAVTSAPAK